MHLRIRQYGEPILREKGQRFTVFDEKLKALADDMIETMYASDAAALAAQQVGHAVQLTVIDIVMSAKYLKEKLVAEYDGKEVPLDLIMPLVLVNPELKPVVCNEISHQEGCMSFDGIYLQVMRPEKVHCVFQDINGVSHEIKCDGILARCIQHEYDHLHGVLFIDRLEPRVLMGLQTKLKKLKRQARDFLKKNRS